MWFKGERQNNLKRSRDYVRHQYKRNIYTEVTITGNKIPAEKVQKGIFSLCLHPQQRLRLEELNFTETLYTLFIITLLTLS